MDNREVAGRWWTRRGFSKAAGAAAVGLWTARGAAESSRGLYASALGCALDGKTDDTAKLNAALATATAQQPVHLVIDGLAAVRGLVLAAGGHTTIEGLGWDTGIVVLPGSDGDGVRIGPYAGVNEGDYGKAGERTAARIALRHLRIDGGRSSKAGPNLKTTMDGGGITAAGRGVYGAILTNVQDVTVEDVFFVNAPLYALCMANCGGVRVSGCKFEGKRDGVHIDGPAKDIVVEDCSFATGDDAIALNAPEGYAGDIEDVRVSRCFVDQAWTLLRIYTSIKSNSGDTKKVRRVVVSDCTGKTMNPPFNLGIENAMATDVPGQVEDVLIRGCSLDCGDGFAVVRTPFQSLTFRDCTWRGLWEERGVGIRVMNAMASLALENFTVLRSAETHAAVTPVEISATVGELVLNGLRVVDPDGSAYAPVPFWVSLEATVTQLRIESVGMAHTAGLLNVQAGGWSRVAKGGVSGAGVLGTGAPVPDAAMADGAEYVSAETGLVSVKVGGVVKKLIAR